MKINPTIVFSILCSLFLVYSVSIYLSPLRDQSAMSYNPEKAAEGRLVWQKYNCQSCHQLYGLGGYLGPDLTNIYSTPMKGPAVINAMVKYGVKQMPPFQMNEEEITDLIEFLKTVDASGKSDPRQFTTTKFGMIESNEKQNQYR